MNLVFRQRLPGVFRGRLPGAIRLYTLTKEGSLKSTVNKDGHNKGVRLTDYVNSDKLEINMIKQVNDKLLFNSNTANESLLPEKIRPVNGNKMDKDILEPLTILGLEIWKFQRGETNDDNEIWKVAYRIFPKLHPKEKNALQRDIKESMCNRSKDTGSQKSFICRILKRYHYTWSDFLCWIQCIQAPSLSEAITSMSLTSRWPAFLLRFTFRRDCTSRTESYHLLKLFESEFQKLDKHSQMFIFIKLVRATQQQIIDILPKVCEIFIQQSHPDLVNSFTYNQILWQISRFGTGWSEWEARALSNAQKVVAENMARNKLQVDTKGYLALAYTLRKIAPEQSQAFVNHIKHHSYEYSEQELWALDDENLGNHRFGAFPYRQGILAMQIALCEDSLEALSLLDSSQLSDRTPAVWGMLLSKVIELGQLTPDLTDFLWKKILNENVRLTPQIVHKILDGCKTSAKATRVFQEALNRGCHVNHRLLIKCVEMAGFVDVNQSRLLMKNIARKDRETYNAILRTEAYEPDSGKIWKTYVEMRRRGYEPTRSTLKSLLISANRDTSVKWEGVYATQRSVVEFKKWVRGAHVDSTDIHDLFKIYPDVNLFHNYIRMLGKAKYHQDLLEILPWMDRIGLQPNKDCLCGLVVYSPNGKYLYQHGQVVGGDVWPTQQDIESYKYYEQINN